MRLQLAAQVGVRQRQFGRAPARPSAARRRSSKLRGAPRELGGVVAAERPVGGQHGRPGMRPGALVHRVDIAERGAAVDDVVPRRRRAGPVAQGLVELQVGDQPRRVARVATRRPAAPPAARSSSRAAMNSGVARTTCARGPAFEPAAARGSSASTVDRVAPLVDAQHGARATAAARRAAAPAARSARRCLRGQVSTPAAGRAARRRRASAKPCRLAK